MGIINHTHFRHKVNLKIESGKNKEQKIMKPKVLLVEQGRCSKRQKSSDTRGNE